MNRILVPFLVLLVGVLPILASDGAQAQFHVTGVARDASGAGVAGAQVTVHFGKTRLTTTTDSAGAFRFVIPAPRARVRVEAAGFQPTTQEWTAPDADQAPPALEFVLQPELVRQHVTVTATRFPAEATSSPANVEVVTAAELRASPGLRTDDVLRAVTGFSLFRRSSSRIANPTTQGVSLRGLTSSGASRALVLADGTPLNDPFGSWVYWDRIPRTALERVEVMRGGASDLYGADALSGVIQLFTTPAGDSYLRVESYGGSQETGGISLTGGIARDRWQFGASGEAATTEGYIPVAEAQRGTVDQPAGSRYLTLRPSLRYTWSPKGMLFLRGGTFGESRENGTALTDNNTRIREVAAGADLTTSAGILTLRADGGWQVFNQTFTAVAADRNSEQLTRSQRLPARTFGLSALWHQSVGGRHTVVLGSEGRSAHGVTEELGFGGSGNPTSRLEAGGRRRTMAAFASSHLQLHSRWTLTLGGRFDHWLIADGESRSQPLAPPGGEVVTSFPDRTETAFSPRAGLLYQMHPRVSLSASAYRAFRAPTLNELYRGFRVGNVVTQANPDLSAERLTGVEGSIRMAPAGSSELRATFFWNDLNRPIANRTLSITPALITRRRENLGRLRSTGLEVEATLPVRHFRFTGGYQFTHSIIESFAADPALEGLRVPQVPQHQVTIEATYIRPHSFSFSLRPRWSSSQFDDDRNLFLLRDYFLMDAMFSFPLRGGVDVYVSGENIFGQRYDLGRTPVLTVGPPVQVRVGVRYELRKKR